MMVQKQYLIEKLKEVIIPIAEKYHISKVYLFRLFCLNYPMLLAFARI